MRVGGQRGGGEITMKRRLGFHCCTLSSGHGIVGYSGQNWWPVALATPRGPTMSKVYKKAQGQIVGRKEEAR